MKKKKTEEPDVVDRARASRGVMLLLGDSEEAKLVDFMSIFHPERRIETREQAAATLEVCICNNGFGFNLSCPIHKPHGI